MTERVCKTCAYAHARFDSAVTHQSSKFAHVHNFARIAQSVERHVEGVRVGGSKPSPGTNLAAKRPVRIRGRSHAVIALRSGHPVFSRRTPLRLGQETAVPLAVVLAYLLNGDKIVGFKNWLPHFYP